MRNLRKEFSDIWEKPRLYLDVLAMSGDEFLYDGMRIPNRAAGQAYLDIRLGSRDGPLFMNLDGMFDWIRREKSTMSERLFRVELRADILDDETYNKFKSIVLHTARTMFAHAKLLNQSPIQPQIAIIMNDGYVSQKEIEMFEDLMAPDMIAGPVDTGEEQVSGELLAALANKNAEKN